MRLIDAIHEIGTMNDEDRGKYGKILFDMLSPISKNQLLEFQNGWDGTKTFANFKLAQAYEIQQCFAWEEIIGRKFDMQQDIDTPTTTKR